MRHLLFTTAAVFLLSSLPSAQAEASPAAGVKFGSKAKTKKKKKKKGKKGRKKKGKKKGKKGKKGGRKSPDNSGSNSGSGGSETPTLPHGVSAMVKGAGQRLSFSFGGSVKMRQSGPWGQFFIALHPSPPTGETVNVTCRYNQFSDLRITSAQSRFEMQGRCQRLFTDGHTEWFDASNSVTITNGAEGDSIDVEFNGGGGISIPAGALSFGDFIMMSGEDPAS